MLNLVSNQLITILWAIYRYIYHLCYDNMNAFVNREADTPFAPLTACNLEQYSGPVYPLQFEPNFTMQSFFLLAFKDSYSFTIEK